MYIAIPLCEHPHPPIELICRAVVFWQSFCPFCGGDELLWDSWISAWPDVGIGRKEFRCGRAGLGWLFTLGK